MYGLGHSMGALTHLLIGACWQCMVGGVHSALHTPWVTSRGALQSTPHSGKHWFYLHGWDIWMCCSHAPTHTPLRIFFSPPPSPSPSFSLPLFLPPSLSPLPSFSRQDLATRSSEQATSSCHSTTRWGVLGWLSPPTLLLNNLVGNTLLLWELLGSRIIA